MSAVIDTKRQGQSVASWGLRLKPQSIFLNPRPGLFRAGRWGRREGTHRGFGIAKLVTSFDRSRAPGRLLLKGLFS